MPRNYYPPRRGRGGRFRPSPSHQQSDNEQDHVLYTPQHPSHSPRPYRRIIIDDSVIATNNAATLPNPTSHSTSAAGTTTSNTPDMPTSMTSPATSNPLQITQTSKRQAQRLKKQAKRDSRRARKRGVSHFVHTTAQQRANTMSRIWYDSDIDWGDEYDRAVDFVNESLAAALPPPPPIFEPEQPVSINVTYLDESDSDDKSHVQDKNVQLDKGKGQQDLSDDVAEEIGLDSIDLMSSFARSIVNPYPSPPHDPQDSLDDIELPDRILTFELDSHHFVSSSNNLTAVLPHEPSLNSTIAASSSSSASASDSASDSEHSASESISKSDSDSASVISSSEDITSSDLSSSSESDDSSEVSSEDEEEEEDYYDRVGRTINNNSYLISHKMNRKERKNLARAIEQGKDLNSVLKGKKPSADPCDTTDSLVDKLKKAWSVDQNAKRERKQLREQARQTSANITLNDLNEKIKSFILHSNSDVYTFGPMSSGKRAGVHLLADEYHIGCKSYGSGSKRCPSIYRTLKSRIPKDERSCKNINSIIMASQGQRGPMPYKRGGRVKGLWMALLSEGRQYATTQNNNHNNNSRKKTHKSNNIHHQHRSVSSSSKKQQPPRFSSKSSKSSSAFASSSRSLVGEGVDKINETNVGFRMLKQLGWTEGGKMGAGSHGTVDPLVAVIKTDRRGLGG